MAYDVTRIRKDFPSLESGIAYFDGPGGSQVPRVVGEVIGRAITQPSSNRGVVTESEINADNYVKGYRNSVADLLNCDPRGVVYGRSWTQLTYDFSRTIAKSWNKGDEIIVSQLDHDSNIRPWVQAAEARGVTVKWAKVNVETSELDTSAVTDLLSPKTRLVAVTGASNTLGTKPDIEAIGRAVKANGSLYVVDGVHLTPHAVINFKSMTADLYGFSPYKLLGPHCATMVADPSLLESFKNDKLLPSTMDVPERFEFGTLPYELMAGVTAAIDYVADLDDQAKGSRREKLVQSINSLEEYEQSLFDYMKSALESLPGITIYSRAKNHTPTAYFNFAGVQPTQVHQFMATLKVNVPGHNFYALEVSRALSLGDTGAIRAGLAPYSNKDDVDRLIKGLEEFLAKR
ncbi:MAG: cysteine desulfurase-like protein [Candidatus Nanopelagicaceae bacterium]